MASLYDLTADFEKFTDILSQADTSDEMKDAIKDALENLKDDIEEKIENYGKSIKNKKSDIEMRKAEIDRLTELNKADERSIERMKDIMMTAMKLTDKPKIKTSLFSFWIQKNNPSVVVDEQYIENIPAKYIKWAEPEIDKKALMEDLKNGDEETKFHLEGIAHLEQSERIGMR